MIPGDVMRWAKVRVVLKVVPVLKGPVPKGHGGVTARCIPQKGERVVREVIRAGTVERRVTLHGSVLTLPRAKVKGQGLGLRAVPVKELTS